MDPRRGGKRPEEEVDALGGDARDSVGSCHPGASSSAGDDSGLRCRWAVRRHCRADTINGSDKQDIIFALEGDDIIDPGSDLEPDYVFCGPGFDVVNQEPRTSPGVLQYASEPDVIAEDCEERVL